MWLHSYQIPTYSDEVNLLWDLVTNNPERQKLLNDVVASMTKEKEKLHAVLK